MPPRRRNPADDPDSHIGFLDEVETPKKSARRRNAAEDPLDLDSIW